MLIFVETLEAEKQIRSNEINELNRKSIYQTKRNKCKKGRKSAVKPPRKH